MMSQTNNIRLAQPNIILQQQNYTSQNQQIYHQAMSSNSQPTNWKPDPSIQQNGWMAQ